MPAILLLSGPIASGKTTLADELIAHHGFRRLKSSDFLRVLCEQQGREISRAELQRLGDVLDEQTDYRWLINDVARPQIAASPNEQRWLIDSVRKERQIHHFRSTFGHDVLHVHVWAADEVLKERFEGRLAGQHHEGVTSYAEAISHPNELSARALSHLADLVVDIGKIEPSTAAALINDHILEKS